MEPVSVATATQSATTETATSTAVDVGYGGSLTSDMASTFGSHLEKAEASMMAGTVSEPSSAAKALFKPLERIDHEAQQLAQYATDATASGQELSASEIVMLTVRSQEFLFHSQLTANVANRTADGLQQLFKQQG